MLLWFGCPQGAPAGLTRLKHLIYKLTNLLIILALGLSAIPAYGSDLSQPDSGSDYTYGDCSKIDQAALRSEIEQLAHQTLTAESSGLEIEAVVARHWIGLNMDGALDGEVTRAVSDLSEAEGYWSRLWSAWSAERAEAFATTIANDAFGSETFKAKIDELSGAIAAEIAREIEADFARAASVAFLCMKAYVGEQYSQTLFAAFENKVSLEVDAVDVAATNPVSVSIVGVHQKALGGVGVIVVAEISRRIAQKLAQKIAGRIAGKIAGRVLGKAGSTLIPVAGWVIGLGLIVWDLWEGGNGALPQIQEALQSEEVKGKVREEITQSVKDGLPQEVSIVALEIAVNIIEAWDDFCSGNQYVCIVAAENRTFQQILNGSALDQIANLSTLVTVFIEDIGRAELDQAIETGEFEDLLAQPPAVSDLLHATQSVTTTLAWAELAGERIDKVVQYGLYQRRAPTDFDPPLLAAVLAVDDTIAIDKVLALDQTQLTLLVKFAGSNFPDLIRQITPDELQQLVAYLAQPQLSAATTVTGLVGALISGTLSVDELVHPKAGGEAVADAPAEIDSTSQPGLSARPVWYEDRIVIATAGLVGLVLLVLAVTLFQHRRSEW